MMNYKVKALALSLLMPALMMADGKICLPENSARSATHFVAGALTGAGQGYVANQFQKDLSVAKNAEGKEELTANGYRNLQVINVLAAIAGGHVNDLAGERVVNTVLLSKTGEEARRTDADKIYSALGQQAGHALVAKNKFALAANPFDLMMLLSWAKNQLQAAQDYAAAEVAEYSSTDDVEAKAKMMKRK